MTFYLGCPEPSWLRLTDVPLMLSRNRLSRVITLPAARGRFAIDSGGFTEIARYGRWRITARDYAALTRQFAAQLGEPDFVAPQDLMVEDSHLRASGLSVEEHQLRSVCSYVTLRSLAPELPWLPVLQGVTIAHYLSCARMFAIMGVDLAAEPLVGIGSVCRRQNTVGTALLFRALRTELGLHRLHGFGLKSDGLALFGEDVVSADSMSFSYGARRAASRPDAPPCPEGRGDCRNCFHHALSWRDRVVQRWERTRAQAGACAAQPARLRPRRPPAQLELFPRS